MESRWSSGIGAVLAVGSLGFAAVAIAQEEGRTIRTPQSRVGTPNTAAPAKERAVNTPSAGIGTPDSNTARADERQVETPLTNVETRTLNVRTRGRSVVGLDLPLILPNRPFERSVPLPSDVLFDFNKAELTDDGVRRVGEVADIIQSRTRPNPVVVEGHTDCRGSTAHNFDLSLRRALAVRRELRRLLGARSPSLPVEPFGESRPTAPNTRPDGSDDPDGREANRRVEVHLDGSLNPRRTLSTAEVRRFRRCAQEP